MDFRREIQDAITDGEAFTLTVWTFGGQVFTGAMLRPLTDSDQTVHLDHILDDARGAVSVRLDRIEAIRFNWN